MNCLIRPISSLTILTRNVSRLSKKNYVFPKLNEYELEENFISGWGPGGQKVNTAQNCCQLKHIPTGIIVKVHQRRELSKNREIAREQMLHKLDKYYNGEQCFMALKEKEENEKKIRNEHSTRRKRDRKSKLKEAFEEFSVKVVPNDKV